MLAFVFASLLAFVPLLMALVSIMTTFLVLWGVTTITSVSMIVEFLVAPSSSWFRWRTLPQVVAHL